MEDHFKTEFDEETFAAKFEALESIFKFRNSHSKVSIIQVGSI